MAVQNVENGMVLGGRVRALQFSSRTAVQFSWSTVNTALRCAACSFVNRRAWCGHVVRSRAGELRRHDAAVVGRMAQPVSADEGPIPCRRRRLAAVGHQDRQQRLGRPALRHRQPPASFHRLEGTFAWCNCVD